MAGIKRQIQAVVVKLVTNGTDEVEEVRVKTLVPFDPPVCGFCHQEMRNVITIEGKRRYQCVTWECSNKAMYDQEVNRIGQGIRYS